MVAYTTSTRSICSSNYRFRSDRHVQRILRCCYLLLGRINTTLLLSIIIFVVHFGTTSSSSCSSCSTNGCSSTHQNYIDVVTATHTQNPQQQLSYHRQLLQKSVKPILFLDVDHTLYDDRIYKIEQQIIHSIHQFVFDHFNNIQELDDILLWHYRTISAKDDASILSTTLTKYQKAQMVSDYLHHQHGSTINGLVYLLREQSKTMIDTTTNTNYNRKPAFVSNVQQQQQQQLDISSQILELQKKFYETVYHPTRIDYSSLLLCASTSSTSSSQQHHHLTTTPVNTGYGHCIPSSSTTTTQDLYYSDDNIDSANCKTNRNQTKTILQPYTNEWLRELLHSITKLYDIRLASNSPIRHVQSIVQAMGLCTLFTTLPSSNTTTTTVYTPDTIFMTTTNKELKHDSIVHLYPTKLQPFEFFSNVLLVQPPRMDENISTKKMIMIDDSKTICQTIQQQSTVPMDMIHLDYSNVSSLLHAICLAMGWIQPHFLTSPLAVQQQQQQQQHDDDDDNEVYQFNDIQYLQHKNVVDLQSIHLPTYNQMLNAVIATYENSSPYSNNTNNTTSIITIVDVGAGVLFMLKTLLGNNKNHYESRLPSLLSRFQHLPHYEKNAIHTTLSSMKVPPRYIHYYAYEPNEELYDTCHQQLVDLDFELQTNQYTSPPISSSTTNLNNQPIRCYIYQKSIVLSSIPSLVPTIITVHLCFCDYRSIPTIYQQSQQIHDSASSHHVHESNYSSCVGLYTPIHGPNLIVGCCFADLFPNPNELISSLLRWFGIPPLTNDNNKKDRLKHSILYFPITFTGITSVYPPHPFETVTYEDQSQQIIPSDTVAFRHYAKALVDVHHHNLDYYSIISSVKNYGGITIRQGTSNWIINSQSNKYLWESMMHFFGTVAAPAIQKHGWYARGWLQRLVHNKPIIQANNVDLLFRIPFLGQWEFPQQIIDGRDPVGSEIVTYDEISFTGPYEVTCIKKDRNVKLKPNQVLIQSEFSLISSGTELKIFQGKFDDDALLDTTIQDFSQEKMSYPLSYGYSLVGRVIECGTNVADADILLGQRVFTFSAHASQVVTDRSSIQIVPDDIDAIDAIFLPSVETALSLVHDARPIIGENIAIFGQGLIGLLVTAVIQCQFDDNIVEISRGKFGTITTFDIIPDRLAASAQMGASQALLPTSPAGPFDVVLEVSGNRMALQKAIDTTCHAGRLIIGSWYGCDEISLKLGIDFHRSHKTIKASQVSEIPPELSKTWSKERRFSMTWALLKNIRPSRLITLRTTIDNAQKVYAALSNGTQIAVAFEY